MSEQIAPATAAGLGDWALGLVDRLSVGLIVLSESRRVVFANGEALRLLSAGPLILKDGVLSVEPDQRRAFERLFEIKTTEGDSASVLLDTSHDGKLVLLLEADGVATAMGGACTLWLMDNQPGAVRVAWLGSAFGLTPGESRVVEALAGGLTTEAVAEKLKISIATVRTHLQRIYLKTDTRTQGGLVRLALLRSVA